MSIKPFCVNSDDLTNDELSEMLYKCVSLGANAYDWVIGFGDDVGLIFYEKDKYNYWGVSHEVETLGHNNIGAYNHNIMAKYEAFKMLGLTSEIQNNKPNWSDAPEWANYLAMDANGKWHWYETEPSKHGSGSWIIKCGRVKEVLVTCNSWRNSLEPRPE